MTGEAHDDEGRPDVTTIAGDRDLPGPETPLVLRADAIVSWAHRRGAGAAIEALVRVRATARQHHGDRQLWVVASQLRDTPRGLDVLGDVAGLANTVAAQLLGPSVDRRSVRWFSHHGAFSSYDPAGPETFYELELHWDGNVYLASDLPRSEQRLIHAEAKALEVGLALAAVDDALAELRRADRSPSASPTSGEQL